MPTPTAFDGLSVNGSSDYIVLLQRADQQAPYTMAPAMRERTNQMPVVDSRTYGARAIPFTVILKAGASITGVQFDANVRRYFAAWSGTRILAATLDDGTTAVQISAEVTQLDKAEMFVFEGEFLAPEGAWRSTTTNTDAASPLTAGGTYKALPTITITPSTSTLNRRRVTITDNTARGLSAYIIQAAFDSTGVSATLNSNYAVFFQGRSIPFYVNTPNNASTKLYFRVDVPPSGSATVDIYYGSSVANSVTNDKLDDAGMALTSATFSNTQWEWDAPFTISTNPRGAAGSWVAAKLGNHVSGMAFAISSETGANVTFQFLAGGTAANDVDGFVVVIPAGAGTTNALSNLSRDDISAPTGTYTFYIKYRIAGQLNWTVADTYPGGAARTTAVDLDNAVEIACYVEAGAAADLDAEWKTTGGNLTLALDSTKTPTVTVGSAVTARYLNSTLTNTTTGDTIAFTDVYLDDVAITITILPSKTITVASGPIYGSITMSDADDWFDIPVGSVSWTNPTNGSASIAWADRYLA